MGVAELRLAATGSRLTVAELPGEARQTGVRFAAPVRVRTVIALSVDTGTRCKHTGEPGERRAHLQERVSAAPTSVAGGSVFAGGGAVLTARASEVGLADARPVATDALRALEQDTGPAHASSQHTLTSHDLPSADLSVSGAGVLVSTRTGTAVWTVEAPTAGWSLDTEELGLALAADGGCGGRGGHGGGGVCLPSLWRYTEGSSLWPEPPEPVCRWTACRHSPAWTSPEQQRHPALQSEPLVPAGTWKSVLTVWTPEGH